MTGVELKASHTFDARDRWEVVIQFPCQLHKKPVFLKQRVLQSGGVQT